MDSQVFAIKGSIESVGKTQSFGQKGFTKREFVITPDTEDGSTPRYPNYVPFVLQKDKCSSIGDGLHPGDHVTVKFAINGRKWDSPEKGVRYFTDLVALSVTTDAAAAKANIPAPSVPEAPDDISIEPADDLPF